jgi:DNA-binding protein HU-beta
VNKTDLAERMASDIGISKARAADGIESLIRSTTDALKQGDRVAISGFGSFVVYQRKARNLRHPQTGRIIRLKSRRVARFTAGSELKNALNRG